MSKKNSEKFLEELGNIDDKFLEEAMNYKTEKKFSVKRIVAVAACAALVIAAFPLVKNLTSAPANTDGTGGTGTVGGIIDATNEPVAPVIKLGESGTFTIWESSRHAGNDVLNGEHNVEGKIGVTESDYTDKTLLGTKKTIEINGKTFVATYVKSFESSYYNNDRDMYQCATNGAVAMFEFNRETGMLTYFNIGDTLSETMETELSQDECYAIGLKHLEQYIDDLEEYELQVTSEITYRNAYQFTLNRVVNGIITSDCVNVAVTKNGEVYLHGFISYGAMENVDLSAVNVETLNNAISEKVSAIYANNFEISQKTKKMILIRNDDDIFYFYFQIEVTGKATADGEEGMDMCILQATMN